MFTSLSRAIAQLADPRLRGVLWRSLAYTLLLFVALHVLVGWGLLHLQLSSHAWLNWIARIAGEIGVFFLTTLLFPGIATLVQSFLLEDVARAVEAAYYPDLPPPRPQGWGEIARIGLRFAAIAIVVNLVALPVYVTLALLGIGIGLYYLVNGYLLARSYWELVAVRRLEPREADALRRAHSGRLLLTGSLLALASSIPLVNLIAPIVATATMVHELEALRRRAGLL